MAFALYDCAGNKVTNVSDYRGNAIRTAYDIAGNSYDLTPEHGEDAYREGRTLVFEDSFSGNAVDETKWGYEIGYVRNNEMQFYTPEQATVEDGMLVLTAVREPRAGRSWLSASLQTNNKFEYMYGRWEAKIKFPAVAGSFPAFWTLGADYEMKYNDDGSVREVIGDVYWPYCGEIDIVEHYPGSGLTTTHGAIYGLTNVASVGATDLGRKRSANLDFSKFHVYSLEWTKTNLSFYVDDVLVSSATITDAMTMFRKPHYMIINLAIGASGGTPPTNCNEMKMYVDWVRVYAPKE